MHAEAMLRDHLINAAEVIDEPCEPALAKVMSLVTVQKRLQFFKTAFVAAALIGLAWSAQQVEELQRQPAQPASSPIRQHTDPPTQSSRGEQPNDLSGVPRWPTSPGTVATSATQDRDAPRWSEDRRSPKEELVPRAELRDDSGARGRTFESSRTVRSSYETPLLRSEIDRRSGCSLTYSDCITIEVDPGEALFSVSAADRSNEVVLIRVEQWGPSSTRVAPSRWMCSDADDRVAIDAETRYLELSLESGSCPDGREARASTGQIKVTLYRGARPT